MKLEESIAKHSLALCRKVPDGLHNKFFPIDSLLLMNEESPFAKTDQFEICRYPERTRLVSVNRTAGLFQILDWDLVAVKSEWRSTKENYALQPIE